MNLLKVKVFIKKNDFLYNSMRIVLTPLWLYQRVCFNIGKFIRKNELFFDKRYINLLKLKGINNKDQKRCFIVATGPSLTLNDLEKLNDEITFSMNSIVNVFDKTEWRPTYYGIGDRFVFESIKYAIFQSDLSNILISSSISGKEYKNIQNRVIKFPVDLLNRRFWNSKMYTNFSNNCYASVSEGFTIAFSLLQIAVYMGYKEIYLLGADCDYSGDKKHFSDYKNMNIKEISTSDKMIYAYTVAKKFAEEHGICIYNATRGGKLEVFDRIDLDKLLITH